MQYDAATVERFWSHVTFHGPHGCWLWNGSRRGFENRYGAFHLKGKMVKAHRFGLELRLGRKLRAHEKARHTCDEPLCVRHLVPGTQRQNVADMIARGRAAWQKKEST